MIVNSAYYINERANTSIGRMTLSHPVMLQRHRGNHIVTHTSPVYTTAKANRRCFRYLDCFTGGQTLVRLVVAATGSYPVRPWLRTADGRSPCLKTQLVVTRKAVYLSSQLDRILGLNKACLASSGVEPIAPCPVGVCRIDWVAQLTQTKQGGCLYEQPCSQENYCEFNVQKSSGRSYLWTSFAMSRSYGDSGRWPGIATTKDNPHKKTIPALKSNSSTWRKPGIGARPSVRSSSLKALPRGKDSRVLSGMTPRALCCRPVRLPTEERGEAMEFNWRMQ